MAFKCNNISNLNNWLCSACKKRPPRKLCWFFCWIFVDFSDFASEMLTAKLMKVLSVNNDLSKNKIQGPMQIWAEDFKWVQYK